MHPVLFRLGSFELHSYTFFVSLGVIAAILVIIFECRRRNFSGDRLFYIGFAALIGGALGSKLPMWIYYFPDLMRHWNDPMAWLRGKTVVGGIIGGWVAIEIAKKLMGVHWKTGDIFAPALALGEGIGRIGCFLGGCCYGVASQLPWACNFGDGVARHPTQIYSALFCFLLFVYLWLRKQTRVKSGGLFREYLFLYFGFRFCIEFLRATPKLIGGLSGFQLSAIGIFIYLIVTEILKRNRGGKAEEREEEQNRSA